MGEVPRTGHRALAVALTAVLIAGVSACGLLGGTPPVMCDIEPNESFATAQPITSGVSVRSCDNGGAAAYDHFSIPFSGGTFQFRCQVIAVSGALALFTDSGGTNDVVPGVTCDGQDHPVTPADPGTTLYVINGLGLAGSIVEFRVTLPS